MTEEKKKMSIGKKVLIGVGIYLGLGVIGLACYGIPTMIEDSQAKKKAAVAEAQAKEKEAIALAEAEEAKKPAAERFQKAISVALKDSSYGLLNGGVDKILDLRYSEDVAEVDVRLKIRWGEDRMIADGCDFGLAVANEIFKRCPEFKIAVFRFFVDMQDQFGNVKETDVFNYNIWTETFAKVNFENFSQMVGADYNSMWPLADNVYISPGILKGLKKYRR